VFRFIAIKVPLYVVPALVGYTIFILFFPDIDDEEEEEDEEEEDDEAITLFLPSSLPKELPRVPYSRDDPEIQAIFEFMQDGQRQIAVQSN
jgi:hypothetical protein